MNRAHSEKKYKVQICAAGKFSFLDINMSWSPEGDLKFEIFREKEQQFNCVGKDSTQTQSTLRAIPTGVLNSLEKLTSLKPDFRSKRVWCVYPNHTNDPHKEGLEPSIFHIMGEYIGNINMVKWTITSKMTPLLTKRKTEMSIFKLCTPVIFLRSFTG